MLLIICSEMHVDREARRLALSRAPCGPQQPWQWRQRWAKNPQTQEARTGDHVQVSGPKIRGRKVFNFAAEESYHHLQLHR